MELAHGRLWNTSISNVGSWTFDHGSVALANDSQQIGGMGPRHVLMPLRAQH